MLKRFLESSGHIYNQLTITHWVTQTTLEGYFLFFSLLYPEMASTKDILNNLRPTRDNVEDNSEKHIRNIFLNRSVEIELNISLFMTFTNKCSIR